MDPDRFRKDESGYWMKYDEFKTDHKMSWEPVRKEVGGSPDMEYPVARIHRRQIDREIEIAVGEKRRQQQKETS